MEITLHQILKSTISSSSLLSSSEDMLYSVEEPEFNMLIDESNLNSLSSESALIYILIKKNIK